MSVTGTKTERKCQQLSDGLTTFSHQYTSFMWRSYIAAHYASFTAVFPTKT